MNEEEIELQWAEVERLAAYDPVCTKDSTNFEVALQELDRVPESIRYGTMDEALDLANISEVDRERLQRILDRFVAWSEEAGGIGISSISPGSPGSIREVVGLRDFSILALRAASDDSDDRLVSSAVRASWVIRECFDMPLASIGHGIFQSAVERQLKRNIPPNESFYRYGVSRKRTISLMARTAIFDYQRGVEDYEEGGGLRSKGILPCKSIDHCIFRVSGQSELLRIKKDRAAYILELAKVSHDMSKMKLVLSKARGTRSKSAYIRMFPYGLINMDEVLRVSGEAIKIHKRYIDRYSTKTPFNEL